MPGAKISTTGTLNSMKSEEGNDSLDTFIRQAIGKEPFLSFSRTGESPVQWIQVLRAVDQPDYPGWPLLTPVKVEMKKCEKCFQEFFSPINFRRHGRVHRRPLNLDKDPHKNRDSLAAFWDRLSPERAKGIVSLICVTVKDLDMPSLDMALSTSLGKPGIWTLPQDYAKSGSTLLDIIQQKPSIIPISSRELFSILDDASERTFLFAGTADESLLDYVFEEEAAKKGLELRNVVAFTSFLFEYQLVKEWLADKDAESLRLQNQLVAEEEAAQKRQAGQLERKKQKKLRQKEQRAREQLDRGKVDLNTATDALEQPLSAEAYVSPSTTDFGPNSPDMPANVAACPEPSQFPSKETNVEVEAQVDSSEEHTDQGNFQTTEPQFVPAKASRHLRTSRRHVPNPGRGWRRDVHVGKASKSEPTQKLGPSREQGISGNKICTKKSKQEKEGQSSSLRVQTETGKQTEEKSSELMIGSTGKQTEEKSSELMIRSPGKQTEEKSSELMIGSIPVTLWDSTTQKQDAYSDDVNETSRTEHAVLESSISEKPVKSDGVQLGKHWKLVSRHETRGPLPVERGNEDSKVGIMSEKADARTVPNEKCVQSSSMDDDDRDSGKCCDVLSDAQRGALSCSVTDAKEFLERRWKKAIASNSVTLPLSPGAEPPGCADVQEDSSTTVPSSDLHRPEVSKTKSVA